MWFSKIFKKVYYNFCYSFLQSKMIYYTFQYSGERSKTHRFHNKSANAHRGDASVKTSERNTQGFMHRQPHLGFYTRCAVRPVTSLTSHSAVHSLCGTSWGRALLDFCKFYSWRVRSCWVLPLFYWYSSAEHTDTQQFVEVFLSLFFPQTNIFAFGLDFSSSARLVRYCLSGDTYREYRSAFFSLNGGYK